MQQLEKSRKIALAKTNSNIQKKTQQDLCKDSTDVVVSFFEILDWTLWLGVVPAVVNDNEAQVKPTTQLKESVSLVLGPALIMQVLVVLEVRVGRHVHSLQTPAGSPTTRRDTDTQRGRSLIVEKLGHVCGAISGKHAKILKFVPPYSGNSPIRDNLLYCADIYSP